tara:strand:+ start:51 stop:617 length:567 start_codon:yes stop_codon:yes gene_type:complete
MEKHFDIPVSEKFIIRAKSMQEEFNRIKVSNKRSNGPTDWHGVLGEIMFDFYLSKIENKVSKPIPYEWIEFVTTDTASADFEFDYGRTRTDVKTTRYSGLYYQPNNLKFDYYIKMTPIDFENGDLQKPKNIRIEGYLSKEDMQKISAEIQKGNTSRGREKNSTPGRITHCIYENHLRPIDELMSILRG